MQIRPVTKEEYIDASKAESVAFDIGLDFSDPNATDNPDGLEVRRAVFNEGKLVSCLDSIPYEAYLNGKKVGMSGIGGVVSLPEERHKGYVRELFRYVLKESYDKGDALSYLYPFSNAYYRQFGYENSMSKNEMKVPTAAFAKYRNVDRVELFLPGNDDSDIRKIYDKFASNKNCMVARNDKQWKQRLSKDPYKNHRYVYIHYNKNNIADAYVILKPHNDEDTIIAEELAFLNADALKGTLGFIYNFAGKYPSFKITAPEFFNLRLFVAEPYDIDIKNICFGMTRVVNATLAFETLDMRNVKNSIAVKVNDDFLSWNNKTFLIRGQNTETVVEETHSEPDMICDVRTLSQILTGYLSLEDAAYLGLAVIKQNKETLYKVFKKGVPCIYDEF